MSATDGGEPIGWAALAGLGLIGVGGRRRRRRRGPPRRPAAAGSRAWWSAGALALALFGSEAASAQAYTVDYTYRSLSSSVDDFVDIFGGGYEEDGTEGYFGADLDGAFADVGGGAFVTAGIATDVSPTAIRGRGTLVGRVASLSSYGAQNELFMEQTLIITEPTTYRLTASAVGDSFGFGTSEFDVSLFGPGEGFNEGLYLDEDEDGLSVDQTGTLQPGTYFFQAIARTRHVEVEGTAGGSMNFDFEFVTVEGADEPLVTLYELEQPPQTSTELPQSEEEGDPVNTATGEVIVREPPDLDLGGPFPLRFVRRYGSAIDESFNGAVGSGSALGRNWRHNHDWRLTAVETNLMLVVTPDGRPVQMDSSDGFLYAPAEPTDVDFQMLFDGLEWRFLDPRAGREVRFDGGLQLVEVSDTLGNSHNYTFTVGRLTQIEDEHGRTLTLTYNGDALETVSDGTRTVTFTQAGGNLAAVTDVNNATTVYTYAPMPARPGLLTSQVTPSGDTLATWDYDARGRATSQGGDDVEMLGFVYATDMTEVTDPNGHTSVFHYADGALTSHVDGEGYALAIAGGGRFRETVGNRRGDSTQVTWAPDIARRSSVTRADGSTVATTWTPSNPNGISISWLETITWPDGTTETFNRDGLQQLTEIVDRAGNTWSMTRNAEGQVTSSTNPRGGTITLVYNADGTLDEITDHAGNVTSFGYDGLGRWDGVTRPDGTTLSLVRDNRDRVTARTDELGNIVTRVFDPEGRLTSLNDRAGEDWSLTWDAQGRLTGVTDPKLQTLVMTYNGDGTISSIAAPDGSAVQYSYDDRGALSGATDGEGNTWSFGTDADEHLVANTTPAGHTTTMTRDPLGRLTSVTSPLGIVKTFSYDGMGRPTTLTDGEGYTTTASWGPTDQLTALTAPSGATTALGRDALGLLTTVTDPAGGVWTRTYDAQGRRTALVDPLGQTVSLTYNNRSLIETVTTPEGTVARGYDAAGRLLSQAFSDGLTITFTRDARGELLTANDVNLARDERGDVIETNGVSFTRDGLARIDQMSFGAGLEVDYAYDGRGRLESVTDWLGGTTTFTYDDDGRRTGVTRPNGVVTTMTWDDDGRLVGRTDVGGAVDASIVLERDGRGFVTSADRSLPQAPTLPVDSATSWTYDAASQPVGDVHDGLGRPTQSAGRQLTWDLAGRLTSATVGGVTATFTYDGLGQLLTRTSGGVETALTWSYAHALPTVTSVATGGAPTLRVISAPDGENLYTVDVATGERSFFHYDEAGNTTFVSADDGTVRSAWSMTPFGEVLGGGTAEGFVFNGRQGTWTDAATGLVFMRKRWYDPLRGRFLTREQQADQLSPWTAAPYGYAAQNPLAYTDPRGAEPEAVASTAVHDFLAGSDKTGGYGAFSGPGGLLFAADQVLSQAQKGRSLGGLGQHIVNHVDDFGALGKKTQFAGERLQVGALFVETLEYGADAEAAQFEALSSADASLDNLGNQLAAFDSLGEGKYLTESERRELQQQIIDNYNEETAAQAKEVRVLGFFYVQQRNVGTLAEAAVFARDGLGTFVPVPLSWIGLD